MTTLLTANFNDTLPVAPVGRKNIAWLADPPTSAIRNISASILNFGGVDARTTTNESVGRSSQGKLVTLTNASATAVIVGPAGSIQSFGVNSGNGGTGYVVNDVVTVSGGTGGTLTVAAVASGVVTALTLNTGGSGYSTTTGATTTGGTGTGLKVDIFSVASDVFANLTLFMENLGAGLVTITPGSGHIIVNGVSLTSTTLATGQGIILFWDGTNWTTLSSSGSGASVTGVQTESYTYSADTGAANAYVATLSPAPGSYTVGLDVTFLASHANTGSSTLNVNGLGAVTIKKSSGGSIVNLTSGDIINGQLIRVKHDGTNFQMLGGAGGGGGGFTAGGDLSGTSSSQEVIGILNKLIDGGGPPTDGQIIQYSSSTGMWELLVDRPIVVVSAIAGKPSNGQLVCIYTAYASMIFPANFSTPNSVGSVGTNPTSTATYTVYKNGVTAGTVVVSTIGGFTFTTTGGTTLTLNAGDRLTIVAPGTQDATMADTEITLVGTRTATVPATVGTGIFKWQGAYNGATAYNANDVVSYFGNVYICTTPTTGNAPTNTSFWALAMQNQPGGALTFDYLFSTSTSNADPGSGKLALNNSTMNTATAVYIDVTDFNGTGQTATLDSLDSSTNTNKAQFRFTKKGDVTKWLIFTMQSRTTHTGYREYALTNVSSSTASPFSNNDELLLTVSIAGDAGGGATGTQIQNQAFTYFADSGSANAYAGTISPTPSYTNGLSVLMKVANANTGASTLNLNSLGTKNIYKDQAGTLVPLTGGELSAGQMVPLSYDGTQFQITGGGGGDVTAKYVLGDFDTQLTNSAKNSTVYLGPDVCPASPNTLNDEFDDTTGNSGTINGLNARWSWMNQGSSTATFKGSKLVLYGPAASSQHQVRGIYVALPGSPPWEVEAKLSILDIGGQYGGGGIFLRESATGKLVCFHMQNETPWMVHIRNFNSFNNSYNSDSKSTSEFGSLYYEFYAKINLTSTTLTYSFSPINNGVDFRTYVTTALTAFFTTAPDGIGIETVAYSQDSVTVCDYFRRTV